MTSPKCSAFNTYLVNLSHCSSIDPPPICGLQNIMNVNNVIVNSVLNPFTNSLKISNLKNWIAIQTQKLNSIYQGIDSNLTWQDATYCKFYDGQEYIYPLNPYKPHTNIYNLGYNPSPLIGKEFENMIISKDSLYRLPPYAEYFISTDLFIIIVIILVVVVILYGLIFNNSNDIKNNIK